MYNKLAYMVILIWINEQILTLLTSICWAKQQLLFKIELILDFKKKR